MSKQKYYQTFAQNKTNKQTKKTTIILCKQAKQKGHTVTCLMHAELVAFMQADISLKKVSVYK